LTFLIIYLVDRRISPVPLVPCAIIGIIVNFVIIPPRIKHHYEKQVDKFYSNPSNSNFLLKTELIIDENGIQSKDETTTTAHSWPAFVKKAETNDYFYLYLNSQLALVIPKRIFTSPKEKIEFESLLLAHFPLQAELNNLEKIVSAK
jgi:YcxB-like protein